MKNRLSILLLTAFCFAYTSSFTTPSSAQEKYSGWEKDSSYNNLYNYKERDSLKGKIIKFKKLTPMKGMAPGTSIVFEEGDEHIIVHLCPWDYASPKETGLREGVKTKIKGAWAMIGDEDVFMASKVKQGNDYEFKVRLTKDGTPFWTMSTEEIAKEKQQE